MRTYSPFFQTLYDETAPVGSLGSGTHYSVFRATVFHDEVRTPLLGGARFQDFAVIWDGDHDERVFQPIERLYRSGDLPSFIIFGERKGTFVGLVAPKFTEGRRAAGEEALRRACQDVGGDSWATQLGSKSNPGDGGIINANQKNVAMYLSTINMLWSLGLKDIVEPKTPDEPE
jgi:hypothetical protein